MSREAHVRFWERAGVRVPRATRFPLYRQGEIYARHGVDIPRSTLIDWCGQATAALQPLVERIRAEVFRTDRLHVDDTGAHRHSGTECRWGPDTPVRVLDPKVRQTRGKERGVKEGRIWTYVRDDRPWNGPDPPVVAYLFSPDRPPRACCARFLSESDRSSPDDRWASIRRRTSRASPASCRPTPTAASPSSTRPRWARRPGSAKPPALRALAARGPFRIGSIVS